jgi:hypothetical protein
MEKAALFKKIVDSVKDLVRQILVDFARSACVTGFSLCSRVS